MNEAYTEAIREAFALAPSDVVIYHTLEIRQTGVQDPVFLVQSRQKFTAFDENSVVREFEPVGFAFSLPPSNEEGFRSLNITIDNIGRRVSDFVEIARSEREPVVVIYRPYLSTNVYAPQMDPPLQLWLKEIQITTHQVTGRATFMDVVNRKFPLELYTRGRFPSLG